MHSTQWLWHHLQLSKHKRAEMEGLTVTHGTCIGRRCSESSRVVVHCVCCGVEGIDGILCEVVWSSIGPGQDVNLPGCIATRIPWDPSLWAPESLLCITVRACHRKQVSCQQRPSLQTLPRDAISSKMKNSRAAQGFKQHKAWPQVPYPNHDRVGR